MRDWALGDDDNFDQLYGAPAYSGMVRFGAWKDIGPAKIKVHKAGKDDCVIVEWKPVVDLTTQKP